MTTLPPPTLEDVEARLANRKGFWASLSPEAQKAFLAYDGPEVAGSLAMIDEPPPFVCPQCGEHFERTDKSQKFCTTYCLVLSHRMHREPQG